jgi:hypothetical protein
MVLTDVCSVLVLIGVFKFLFVLGNVCQTDSVVLHHPCIEEILNWTKKHLLDIYLASADVIIE